MTKNTIDVACHFIGITFDEIEAATLNFVSVTNNGIMSASRIEIDEVTIATYQRIWSKNTICNTNDVIFISPNKIVLPVNDVVFPLDAILCCYDSLFVLAGYEHKQREIANCLHIH